MRPGERDTPRPMELTTVPDNNPNQVPEENKVGVSGRQTPESPRLIQEVAGHPDFPNNVLGTYIDIGGYAGVAIEIVGKSLKVRSMDGPTRGFNVHVLRRLYGPALPAESETTTPLQASRPESPSPDDSVEEAAEEAAEEPAPKKVIEPDFNAPVTPIAELAMNPEFPQNSLGRHVDIGGFTGVVVGIVSQSLKVRSPEGRTRSFNHHVLRKLHAPATVVPVMSLPAASATSEPVETLKPEPEAPSAEPVIAEPDFSTPVTPMAELTAAADFPQCAFGRHVDVNGYLGVVVKIINRSLKIKNQEGQTRSYNADQLRKLFGK